MMVMMMMAIMTPSVVSSQTQIHTQVYLGAPLPTNRTAPSYCALVHPLLESTVPLHTLRWKLGGIHLACSWKKWRP
jgi:hypothetical protein